MRQRRVHADDQGHVAQYDVVLHARQQAGQGQRTCGVCSASARVAPPICAGLARGTTFRAASTPACERWASRWTTVPQAAGPSWNAASVATTPGRIPTDAGGSSGSSGGAGGGGGGRRGGALSRSFRTTTTSAARASSSSAPLLLLLDWPRMIRPRRRVQPRSSIYYVATPPAATWWWRSTTSRARCTFHGRPCKKEDALLLRHVNAARRSRPAASNAPSACANKMLAPEDKAASLDPGPPATSMSCAAALRRSFRTTTTTS